MLYSKSTGGFYSRNIHTNIPDDAVEITDKQYQQLLRGQAFGRSIISTKNGVPFLAQQSPLLITTLKEQKISQLWAAFKEYQRKRIDPEDLTLATSCANGGSIKGKAVQEWVLNLWEKYYKIKKQISACTTADELSTIVIDPSVCGELPYTIAELNLEAAISIRP